MNLYATVTSERASKGQGGQYLDIVVQDSNKEILARLFIESHTDSVGDGYKGTLSTADHLYIQVEGEHTARKGEKQKGEGTALQNWRQMKRENNL